MSPCESALVADSGCPECCAEKGSEIRCSSAKKALEIARQRAAGLIVTILILYMNKLKLRKERQGLSGLRLPEIKHLPHNLLGLGELTSSFHVSVSSSVGS